MALHLSKGREGEFLACAYLRKKDFDIVTCNWRHRHYEVDVIAQRDGVLHFVEVKTRHNTRFGFPEEAVTRKKFTCLKKAAESFMNKYPLCDRLQFDILSILRRDNRPDEYFFIEDVYL